MTNFCHSLKISFRSFFPLFTRLLLLSGVLFLLFSCEEEGTIIGKNMLPGNDFVSLISTDTLSIRAYTVYTDSLESNSPSYSYLGELYDPYFGTTTAGFVSQIRMNDEWYGGIFFIDSIKLRLSLTNVSGNTFAGHVLTIAEIADQIYTDTVYYSNKVTPLTGISTDLVLPELKEDTINNITLTVPNSFGEYLLRDTTMLFHSNTVPDFRSYFRGLQFTLQSTGDPVFLTLSLEAPDNYGSYQNYFVVYLSDDEGNQSTFFFLLDAKARNACYNFFSHDRSTAQPDKKIEHINDGYPDTLTYQQCLNGVFTRFTIPGLAGLKNDTSLQNTKINKARITWPVHYDGFDYTNTTLPSRLYMGYIDNNGDKYLVHDYYDQYAGPAFFDGALDTAANAYIFNIPYYVQQYLEDEAGILPTELQLILPSGSVKNAILKANNSSRPVKFDLTYTKF